MLLVRFLFSLFFFILGYRIFIDYLNDSLRGISLEEMTAIYFSILIVGSISFSLFRCAIEDRPFFSKTNFRETNLSKLNKQNTNHKQSSNPINFGPWSGKSQALKNKHTKNNASNNSANNGAYNFLNWLVPENASLGIQSLNNTQTAAFIILTHYCIKGLGFLKQKKDDDINVTLNLISNHEFLIQQISIKNHTINFAIARLENPDAICYFLKEAAKEIIDKYKKGKKKPNVSDILINDIVRWKI